MFTHFTKNIFTKKIRNIAKLGVTTRPPSAGAFVYLQAPTGYINFWNAIEFRIKYGKMKR